LNHEEERISSVLLKYQDALNASSAEAVMSLYAPDGVFMPQHFPSSVGTEAVRQAYDAVFQAIQLTVTFTLAEVVQVAPDWAIARTNSAGTVRFHATGETSAEANQELFVFKKNQGAWQIARYCFSTTNPPRS
jgi:uncharacterized protein (TIGR02246 family)